MSDRTHVVRIGPTVEPADLEWMLDRLSGRGATSFLIELSPNLSLAELALIEQRFSSDDLPPTLTEVARRVVELVKAR